LVEGSRGHFGLLENVGNSILFFLHFALETVQLIVGILFCISVRVEFRLDGVELGLNVRQLSIQC
jgi:hypothetical protein